MMSRSCFFFPINRYLPLLCRLLPSNSLSSVFCPSSSSNAHIHVHMHSTELYQLKSTWVTHCSVSNTTPSTKWWLSWVWTTSRLHLTVLSVKLIMLTVNLITTLPAVTKSINSNMLITPSCSFQCHRTVGSATTDKSETTLQCTRQPSYRYSNLPQLTAGCQTPLSDHTTHPHRFL